MTELKTLKDLIPKVETEKGAKMEYLLYGEKLMEIRAEAIKWIKYYQEDESTEVKSKVLWIKHFFNITEEDLK